MIGIVILNYNSANDTLRCIRSIEEYTNVSYKIYVVDGCSQDNSYEYLSKYFNEYKNVEIIKSDINGGYSYGNNIGAIKAIDDGAEEPSQCRQSVRQPERSVDRRAGRQPH